MHPDLKPIELDIRELIDTHRAKAAVVLTIEKGQYSIAAVGTTRKLHEAARRLASDFSNAINHGFIDYPDEFLETTKDRVLFKIIRTPEARS